MTVSYYRKNVSIRFLFGTNASYVPIKIQTFVSQSTPYKMCLREAGLKTSYQKSIRILYEAYVKRAENVQRTVQTKIEFFFMGSKLAI
jgi:hypothetical protein